MADSIVLDYHNSLLRQSDLRLLQPGDWLNDRLIGFWFEYLENELFVGQNDICLISPEVAQFVKLGSDCDSAMFLEPLDLNSKGLVLLPVNDLSSLDESGGSHWSLLVYDGKMKQCYHLDSANKSNSDQAKKMFSKLGLPTNEKMVDLATTQQQNCSDCGIFVCCHAELVLKHYPNSMRSLPLLSQTVAGNQRSRMLQLISELALKN